jgi:hypothetical protein
MPGIQAPVLYHIMSNQENLPLLEASLTSGIQDSHVPPPFWQVFFLPKADVLDSNSSFIAFCPFTKVIAEGNTIQQAAKNWIKEAKEKFLGPFVIPKYLLTRRKVWFGTGGDGCAPMFIIDFNTTDYAVAIIPNTKDVCVGRMSQWKNGVPPLENFSYPSWMDWPISCTPLMRCSTTNNDPPISLTPHQIN